MKRLRDRVVEGPILTTLAALAAPMVAARMLASIQESVDTMFLGRVSEADMAAPAAVWPLIMLFMGVNWGLTTATVSLVSQLVGAERYDEAERVASRLFGLTLALSVAAGLSIALIAPPVFQLLGLRGEVYRLALGYAIVEAVALPFFFTLLFFNGLRSSLGDTVTPFKLSAASNVINLALDPVLIFGLGPFPAMGVIGAGLATALSRILTGGAAFYLLLSGRLGIRVWPGLPDPGLALYALRTGGPVAGQQFMVSAGFMVMMGIVARLGEAVMAAYNVSLAVIHLVQVATWGFSSATATMVGQALGAGLRERAMRVARISMAVVGGLLAVGSVFLFLLAEYAVSVFTSIPSVWEVSVRMIRILAPAVPFLGVFFVAMGAARGSGWTLPMSILGAARLWLLRIPLAYALALHAGLGDVGVWLAMAASNIMAGGGAALWVLRGSWLKPRAAGAGSAPARAASRGSARKARAPS